ncbi:MAG: hypothetical protein M5U31_07820 [Acidimicrobiia bacterium]|nr:hypothetical protein [Acidimicrobiia bacterium]
MCLIVILGAFAPRAALVILWIFTTQLTQAFDSFWLGFAGFVFLPFTTLLYAIVYQPVVGVDGFGWFLVAFGFILDIANWTGTASRSSQERGYA